MEIVFKIRDEPNFVGLPRNSAGAEFRRRRDVPERRKKQSIVSGQKSARGSQSSVWSHPLFLWHSVVPVANARNCAKTIERIDAAWRTQRFCWQHSVQRKSAAKKRPIDSGRRMTKFKPGVTNPGSKSTGNSFSWV